jgi:hypothetical protein
MFGGLRRFIGAELRKVAELVEHGNDGTARLAEDVRRNTLALLKLDARLEAFMDRWSWPPANPLDQETPAPPGEGKETPPARPRRS